MYYSKGRTIYVMQIAIFVFLQLIYMPGIISDDSWTVFKHKDFCRILQLGTIARMTVIAPESQAARRGIAEAFGQMEHVQALMNDRDEDSELSRLNRTASERMVQVSPELFEVLWEAKEIAMLTGGAFDITIGPEVELWRQMQRRS